MVGIWYINTYDLEFKELLYTLASPLKGTGDGTMKQILSACVPPVLVLAALYIAAAGLGLGTCVKVCSEVINKGLLALMKRGFNTMVQTALGEELPSYCKDCGACVNECPVGALDWKQKK